MVAAVLGLILSVTVGRPCAAVDGGVPTIQLSIGTQRVLTVGGVKSTRVQFPEMVDVRPIGKDQLVVIGAGYGNSKLTVETDGGTKTWSVQVRRGLIECGLFEVAKRFPCGSTLETKTVEGQVVLYGIASSLEEWRTAFLMVEEYPNVVMEGTLRPDVVEDEFLAAAAAFQAHGFSRVKWVRAGPSVTLEGEVFEIDKPKLRALEAEWRPRLELVVREPKKKK